MELYLVETIAKSILKNCFVLQANDGESKTLLVYNCSLENKIEICRCRHGARQKRRNLIFRRTSHSTLFNGHPDNGVDNNSRATGPGNQSHFLVKDAENLTRVRVNRLMASNRPRRKINNSGNY